MNEKTYKEKWKRIDAYTTIMHQGSIIIGNGSSAHKKIIQDYRRHLASHQRVVYIDFSNINNIKSLAEAFCLQYSLLFSVTPKYYDLDDSFCLLNFSIKLFSNIEDIEVMYIWLDNFTEVESWEESNCVYRVLRSLFQHQKKIVHIFTSQNNKDCINIFSNYDNPFFQFALPIKLFPITHEKQ